MPDDSIWGGTLTNAEKKLLDEKVTAGRDVDPIPSIPDAPDISEPPRKKRGVPGTSQNRVDGLTKLKPDELPVVGKHYVVWGSNFLNDIYARPVRRAAPVTEDAHAKIEVEHTKRLLQYGLKNPLWDGKRRVQRAEEYARWRYKGYVCGEVVSL